MNLRFVYNTRILDSRLELILMTDAMEALYCYAQEYLFPSFTAQEKGYHVRFIREDQYEKQLRGLLDESGQKILDDFLKIKINIMLSESRVAFQAGYRSALELFR